MKTTRKIRRPARPAAPVVPSAPAWTRLPWFRLREYLATSPFDAAMIAANQPLAEALTLLKYTPDSWRDMRIVGTAGDLLITAAAQNARDRGDGRINPALQKVVKLMHEHLSEDCGCFVKDGRWYSKPRKEGS